MYVLYVCMHVLVISCPGVLEVEYSAEALGQSALYFSAAAHLDRIHC